MTFLYKAMFVAYCLLALIEAMRYISGGDKYRFLLCIFAPAIPLAVILIFRVLKLRFTWHLNLIILGFTMLAYMIGSCVDLYHSVPGYDKFVHAMSGAFISLLTCVAYYFIKPSHSIEAIDARLLHMGIPDVWTDRTGLAVCRRNRRIRYHAGHDLLPRRNCYLFAFRHPIEQGTGRLANRRCFRFYPRELRI